VGGASLLYDETLHAKVTAKLHHLFRLEKLLWDQVGWVLGACIIQSYYGRDNTFLNQITLYFYFKQIPPPQKKGAKNTHYIIFIHKIK